MTGSCYSRERQHIKEFFLNVFGSIIFACHRLCFVKMLNPLLACGGGVDIFAETVRKIIPTVVGIAHRKCKLLRFLLQGNTSSSPSFVFLI